MLHSRGHRLLMVGADGTSRFEDLEHLWKSMDKLTPKNESAVAVGSRAHLVQTEAVVKWSILRNILMYGLHTIPRIVGVVDIRDIQCGFKLFTRCAAQKIFPAQHLSAWIFDVELLLLAKQQPSKSSDLAQSTAPFHVNNVSAHTADLVRREYPRRVHSILRRPSPGAAAFPAAGYHEVRNLCDVALSSRCGHQCREMR
ncbi:hypothetical protein EDD17DRAFT_360547 [Pisolithus thermaeus]|nr:hypothetical protein EDD17DRAFT_360547 [Pisolithus thermaeus]